MTPADIEAEVVRVRAAFDVGLLREDAASATAAEDAAWRAVAEASLRAREEHEAATRAICEGSLFVKSEAIKVTDLPRLVASAIESAAEIEREVFLTREAHAALIAERRGRAEFALEAARLSPGIVPLQVACVFLGGDVTRCASEETARAEIEDRVSFLRSVGEGKALYGICHALGLDTGMIERAPGGMTVDNVAAALRRVLGGPKESA